MSLIISVLAPEWCVVVLKDTIFGRGRDVCAYSRPRRNRSRTTYLPFHTAAYNLSPLILVLRPLHQQPLYLHDIDLRLICALAESLLHLSPLKTFGSIQAPPASPGIVYG